VLYLRYRKGNEVNKMKAILEVLKVILITVTVVAVLFAGVFAICSWEQKDSERIYNNGVCNNCEVGQYEFSNTTKSKTGHVTYFYDCNNCGHIIETTVQMFNKEPKAKVITVNDVVEKMGCDYFIVKNVDTWAVLEEDVYMDREVVEINICDDTENTLCLFIKLDPNEKEIIRKVTE
jgi:hypothetical protein